MFAEDLQDSRRLDLVACGASADSGDRCAWMPRFGPRCIGTAHRGSGRRARTEPRSPLPCETRKPRTQTWPSGARMETSQCWHSRLAGVGTRRHTVLARLVATKTQSAPLLLRRAAALTYHRRWCSILSRGAAEHGNLKSHGPPRVGMLAGNGPGAFVLGQSTSAARTMLWSAGRGPPRSADDDGRELVVGIWRMSGW